jgi:hypothetical protein
MTKEYPDTGITKFSEKTLPDNIAKKIAEYILNWDMQDLILQRESIKKVFIYN